MHRNMTFGERLGASLRAQGYWNTQRKGLEVGRFCVENGYLPSYVYRWLRGEVPRAEALLLLARHLKADPEWLVGLDDPPAATRRRKPAPIRTGSTALSPPAPRGAAAGVEGLCKVLRLWFPLRWGWLDGSPTWSPA